MPDAADISEPYPDPDPGIDYRVPKVRMEGNGGMVVIVPVKVA